MPMKWLKEVFTLVVGEFGGKALQELLRGEFREGAGVIVERVKRLIKENPRADLLYALLSLPDTDAASLWERYRGVKGTAMENSFVVTVASTLPRKADGTVDVERAKEVFSKLAAMNKEEFTDVVELLKHDPLVGPMRVFIQRGKGFAEALLVGMAHVAGAAASHTKLAENWAAFTGPIPRQKVWTEPDGSGHLTARKLASNIWGVLVGRR